MAIYIVFCNYFNNNVFGTYSSIKRARIAFEDFLTNDEDIVSIEDCGDYSYKFTTKTGKTFSMEIGFDILDAEFVEGLCKEY